MPGPSEARGVRALQVVLDVDGVVRRGTTDAADPEVVSGVKAVLAAGRAHGVDTRVAFLSGTPSAGDPAALPDWCAGNKPLSGVFENAFDAEVQEKRVSINGQLGADSLIHPAHGAPPPQSVHVPGDAGSVLQGCVMQGFTRAEQVEVLERLLTEYHCDLEAVDAGLAARARHLAGECAAAARAEYTRDGTGGALCTAVPPAFAPYAALIRGFDPLFRVLSNGAVVEYHDFATKKAACHRRLAAEREDWFCSSGRAHRAGDEFLFFIVSLTHKGTGVQRILEARPPQPDLQLITVGDTALDYAMHAHADTAFHVGLPTVWEAHRTPAHGHVVRIASADDPNAAPYVAGTVHVLAALRRALDASEGQGLSMPQLTAELGGLAFVAT
eukprot:TRINITY_DN14995_c0_g1_i1.p1 TRINITY_DN14995_c0_g1~~TRINITY_DN14995_c0_g1_i1.p1  ORF type:complete len:385 (+),score=109.08 TRINITY_DN14995_c0_g1_i1:170-1324(+)